MLERAWRVMGWICVALGITTLVAAALRVLTPTAVRWWEPYVLLSLGAAVVLMGLGLAMPERKDTLLPLVLSAWGVTLVLWGGISVVVPDQVLASRRGPQTPGGARVLGVLLVATGAAMF